MWAWQVEPRRVETVTAAMEMPQWKRKEGPPLRIAIAGDFHLRPNGGDLAHKYMETIMEARPNMIFLLGIMPTATRGRAAWPRRRPGNISRC